MRSLFRRGWHHFAFVNDASHFTIYVDGTSVVQVSTITITHTTAASELVIGDQSGYSYPWKGYIDEVRVSNGIARWTANFTPPTAAYSGVYSTSVQFQLASATTQAGLSSATWYGPTGTSDYYTASGTAINSTLNTNSWIKYQATLATVDTAYTPTLNDISLTYTGGSAAYTPATSSDVVVSAAAASKIALSGTTAVAADSLTPVTITSQDASGNSSNPTANAVFNLTVSPANSGKFYSDSGGTTQITTVTISSSTNNQVFYFKGMALIGVTPIITATWASGGASLSSANQTYTITTAGLPAALAFTTQPSSTATAGANFVTQPLVAIQDAYGNTVTTSTLSVTLSAVLASDGTTLGGGTLGGTLGVNAASGVATYSGLNYTKSESIKLKATASGVTAGLSSAITVSPNSGTKLAFILQPLCHF